MYAIIQTGGKQYKVREGDKIAVERLDSQAGETVQLEDVLLIADSGDVTIGTPTVEGAVVQARVVDEVKGEKVVVFKYKPKNRYRVKTGHRQKYTLLQIERVLAPGQVVEQEPEEAEEPEAAEAPVAEATAVEPEVTEAAASEASSTAEAVEEPETPEEISAQAEEAETGEEE